MIQPEGTIRELYKIVNVKSRRGEFFITKFWIFYANKRIGEGKIVFQYSISA